MNHRSRQATLAVVASATFVWILSNARAIDRIVGTTGAFSNALAAAQPGDFITLAPGTYGGGHFRSGLTGVTIRSQDPNDPAVIQGGVNGIQLSDAVNVTIENLIFEQQTGNGLNIDDGGSFASPSTDITLRNLVVRDMNASGNNDGIKLSGVTGFLIDDVSVFDWGAGGSAVDPVGSHHGLIQNSRFVSSVATGGSAVRPKGGSKNITIRANYIAMSEGAGRGIQAGGSTGSQFFRFIDGDSGYEAADIVVEGNTLIGASSAISWVNIDGGVFHRNYIYRPGDWAFRMLNENVGEPIVETQNGVMMDNIVVYEGNTWRRAGNYDGPGVLEETFSFARNHWLNEDDPTPPGSSPQLPTAEIGGVYGAAAPFPAEGPHNWQLDWGRWIVAVGKGGLEHVVEIEDYAELLLATPGEDGEFDPLASDPLTGAWSFEPLNSPQLNLGVAPQTILIRPASCAICSDLPGDYNRSGVVDHGDYQLWKQQFGLSGSALADGNGDGLVTIADYTVWRDNLGATLNTMPAGSIIPEPAALGQLGAAAIAFLHLRLSLGLPKNL